MNHQLFEDWLLDDDPETPLDEQKLETHLDDCEQCRALASGWQGAQHTLDTAPQIGPAPGFPQRFQLRLAEKREAQQRRKSILWIVLALVAGSLIATGLAYPLLRELTFAEIVLKVVTGGGQLINRLFELQNLFGTLFQSTSPLVPLALWVGVALTITILSLIWVFAMWKIIVPQGVKA